MARPIEPTPILRGEDAKRFLREVAYPKYSKEKEKFLAKCEATYQRLKQPCPDCVEKDKQLDELVRIKTQYEAIIETLRKNANVALSKRRALIRKGKRKG